MCSITKPPTIPSAAAANPICEELRSSEFGFSSAWTPEIFERYFNSEFTFSPAWSTKIFERYYLSNTEKEDKSDSENVISDPQPALLNVLKEALSANLSGSPVSNSSNTTSNVGVYTFVFGIGTLSNEQWPNDITRVDKPYWSDWRFPTLSDFMSKEKPVAPPTATPASPFKFGFPTSDPLTALTATPTPTHASSHCGTNPFDLPIGCDTQNPEPPAFKFGVGSTPPLTPVSISSTTTPSSFQSVTPIPATTFKFGAPEQPSSATSPSTFSFSPPKLVITTPQPQPALDSSSVTTTSNSLFGSFKPGSSPTPTPTTPATTANAIPVGPVFGTGNFQPASQSITGGGFVFGGKSQPANNTDSQKSISTGGFNFGGINPQTANNTDSQKSISTGGFNFGGINPQPANNTDSQKPISTGGFHFGGKPQPANNTDSQKPISTGGFNFGAGTSTIKPTFGTFSFGGSAPSVAPNPFSTSQTATPTTGYGFSCGPSNPSMPTPIPFGQVQSPPLSNPTAQPTPMFQFGGTGTPSTFTSFPNSSVPTTNFSFGNHAPGSNNPFGSFAQAQPTPGRMHSPAPSMFNSSNPSTATSFGFGQSSHLNPTTQSAPGFQFGGTGTSPTKRMKMVTTPQAFPSPPSETVPPFNFSATPSPGDSLGGRTIKKAFRRLKK